MENRKNWDAMDGEQEELLNSLQVVSMRLVEEMMTKKLAPAVYEVHLTAFTQVIEMEEKVERDYLRWRDEARRLVEAYKGRWERQAN